MRCIVVLPESINVTGGHLIVEQLMLKTTLNSVSKDKSTSVVQSGEAAMLQVKRRSCN